MSSRQRRHTSSRSISAQKRRSESSAESFEEDIKPIAVGKNWFFQQSPMSQVYYIKVAVGLLFGLIIGILYDNPIIAGNWYIFPFIALGSVYVFTRYYMKISKDDLDDLRLITWTGTVSMFIAFIVASVLIFNIVHIPTYSCIIDGITHNKC